jgi:hypothetical protein
MFCYSDIYQIVIYRNTHFSDPHPLLNIQEWLDGFLVNAGISKKEENNYIEQ